MTRNINGFTIVELLVVIAIAGILTTIGVVAFSSVQVGSRDSQRTTKTTVIVEALEKYYSRNGEYPDCTAMTQPVSTVVSVTLVGMDPSILTTPSAGSGTNSIICTTPSNDTFGYIGGGSQYTLKYREESTGNVISLTSRHNDNAPITDTCNVPGFIVVPGSSTYGTSNFCVMKYEAKNAGGNVPVSRATGTPWASISQTNAITYSANVAMCPTCHLITEAEWLTIAQNVLSVASNWSGGAVGSGYIYSGHNDSSPNNALAADTNDGNGYYGTGNSGDTQRRTLTLTNGEVIWDIAGNVWEWTTGTIAGGQQPGLSGEVAYAWKQWNNGSLLQNGLPNSAMPSYTGISGASGWSSTQRIGQLESNYGEAGARSFRRGGSWDNSSYAGVLSLDFYTSAGSTHASIGFRVAQ